MKRDSDAPEEDEGERDHADQLHRLVAEEARELPPEPTVGGRGSVGRLRGLGELRLEDVRDLLRQEQVGGRRVVRLGRG